VLVFWRLWWGLGWLWVGVVVYLTLTPSPPGMPLFPFADKVAHLLAFAGLMGWFAQLVPRGRWWRTGLALVALGVLIEFLQRWGGMRQFEVADMVADALGVAVGAGLARGPLGRFIRGWDRWLARRFADF